MSPNTEEFYAAILAEIRVISGRITDMTHDAYISRHLKDQLETHGATLQTLMSRVNELEVDRIRQDSLNKGKGAVFELIRQWVPWIITGIISVALFAVQRLER